jgi:RimJ/RimL family protein N-acetyltransferase
MIPVEVREATRDDLAALVAREPVEARRIYEVERFDAQENGEGLLLIAWNGATIHGRVRLRWWSKYDVVRAAFGDFPEINALDAWPTGEGVGSQIIAACERVSAERGYERVGIGVEVTNLAARRLYERLGYEPWNDVVDEWDEFDDAGAIAKVHHDPAAYLIKPLI